MFLELIGVIAAFLLYKWWRMKPFYWADKGVPYIVPLPILGSTWGMFFHTFHGYWNRKCKTFRKHGGILAFHNFSRVSLAVIEPETLKEMVQKSDCFTSRGVHSNPEYDTLAMNVFFIVGEDWKRMRTKLSPYFSPSRLKHTTRQMAVNMEEYSEQFEKAALSGKPVDVNEISLKLAVDVVVNTIFGISHDSFKNPNSFFFTLQEELFNHYFVLRILLGTVSPFLYDLFRVTILPLKTTLKLTGFIQDVFEQRKRNIGVREDFVQGMLETVKKESNFDPNSPKFTEKDAIAQLMGLYMGGTETTGNSISFLLHELALHQDIQDKVIDEVTKVLATEGGIFTYDIVSQLTYTNMVINECLRKYPIVPVITRECTKATSLGGIDIEVGTGITVPLMAIHWDPQYYPEPEKFKPERFAQEHKNNFVFHPFGLGPRTCVGWKMAIIEIAYTLCELLPKYRFLPSSTTEQQIKFNWKPTLNPESGVWLNVEKL